MIAVVEIGVLAQSGKKEQNSLHAPSHQPTSQASSTPAIATGFACSLFLFNPPIKMGKLTSTIGIPIKLLNEAQVRANPSDMRDGKALGLRTPRKLASP